MTFLSVSVAGRPIVEQLLVDHHGANMCTSIPSSAQHQSERFALILLKEDQFVEKHLDSDQKEFFRYVLRDWLSRDDDKLSAAVSCTWGDTNVYVSQAGQDGALVNSTCVRDSCSSGELHIACDVTFWSLPYTFIWLPRCWGSEMYCGD